MKKVIFILYFTGFLVFAYMLIQFFSGYDTYYYRQRNMVQLGDINQLYHYSQEERINELNKIAKEEQVNLYQFNYDIDLKGIQTNIYYCAIGDEKIYNEKFDTERGYITNFNPTEKIKVFPMSDSVHNHNRIWTSVETTDLSRMKSAVNRLTTKDVDMTQLSLSKNNFIEILKTLYSSKIYLYAFYGILILIPVTIYFYFSKIREIYIRKMFGFDDRDIKIHLIGDLFKVQAASYLLAFFVQIIYLYFYNGFNKIFTYLLFYIAVSVLFFIFLLLFNYICLYMVKFANMVNIIKYQKPIRKMLIVNCIFKGIFMLLLFNVFNANYEAYEKIKIAEKNNSKWEILKNYANYNFGVISELPTENAIVNEYFAVNKAQKLFINAEKHGGILVDYSRCAPSSLQIYDDVEWNSKLLFVNKNYLNLELAYDERGKVVTLDSYTDPDTIILLLPAKYKKFEGEISKETEKYFSGMRYFLENSYLKFEGEQIPKRKTAKIEIQYVKDGQSFFLYNPESRVGENSYIYNPILIVVNGQNLGNALALSSMAGSFFHAYIGDESYNFEDLKDDIIQNQADEMIKPYNSYAYKVSRYILQLKNQNKNTILLFCVFLIVEMCVLILSIINYLEKNKQSISVKKMFGYSSIHTYISFFIFWSITAFIVLLIQWNFITNINIMFTSIYLLFEILFSIVLLVRLDKRYIVKWLKRR